MLLTVAAAVVVAGVALVGWVLLVVAVAVASPLVVGVVVVGLDVCEGRQLLLCLLLVVMVVRDRFVQRFSPITPGTRMHMHMHEKNQVPSVSLWSVS